MTRRRSGALILALVPIVLLVVPAAAPALEFVPGGSTMETLNPAGEPDSRAGAHPDRFVSAFKVRHPDGVEDAKDVVVNLPPGLGGNLAGMPFCARRVFAEQNETPEHPGCPADSQVGVLFTNGTSFEGEPVELAFPLYNVEPGPNEVALFGGFFALPLKFIGRLRPGDQGLTLRLDDMVALPFVFEEGKVEFWGVPADHQQEDGVPRKPFLSTPTSCGEEVSATFSLNTWQQPGRLIGGSGSTGHPLVGCGDIPFEPSASFSLGNPVADAPTGARIDLVVPQNEDPDGRTAAQVKEVSVALPEGMTVSPGAVSGLDLCDDAQFGLGTAAAVTCPSSSRVGSVEVTGPGLVRPLGGAMYLGEERPGNRFRLFIVASGMGSAMKLAESLQPDPRTGRLTTTMRDLPQMSFERLSLSFDGGPDALLATPPTCGPAAASATMAPYSGGPPVEWSGSVEIDRAGGAGAPCAGDASFAPGVVGGGSSTEARRPTSFVTTLRRQDGEQSPGRLEIGLPVGMSASLGAVARCSAAAAASGACASASQIGRAEAELGPGPHPARLQGDVYLTGPYRRAPFGIALVFAAKLGPYDLGSLVIRGALRMDPLTGRVTIATDPLPRLVDGIGVRFQTIRLEIDRPGFLRNPTSCAPTSVGAAIFSQAGTVSRSSTPFRTRDCVLLPFRPAFSMALSGRAQLHEHGRPGLTIAVRMPPGNASMRAADIGLPAAVQLDSSGLRAICARRAALAGACPREARVGTGQALTTLLGQPLKGSLYVVQPRDSGTPDLWASLRGEGIRIELRMETAEVDGRVEARMRGLPDVPLRSFAMKLASGEHGLVSLRQGLCSHGKARRLIAPVRVEGQNRAAREIRSRLVSGARCGHG